MRLNCPGRGVLNLNLFLLSALAACAPLEPELGTTSAEITTGAGWQVSQTGDPQIAAGTSQVLATTYQTLWYFDKSGNTITTDVHGNPLITDTKTLFKVAWDPANLNNINDNLQLPSGDYCDRNNPFDAIIPAGSLHAGELNYCISKYYDARVLYDDYRDRFVVVASAYNTASKATGGDWQARRSRLLVAYSASSDLTDGSGWYVYFFDAVPGEGCPDQTCRDAWGYQFGDGADYPLLGLNRRYLMITINNNHFNASSGSWSAKQVAWHVWNANALATNQWDSTTCSGAACSWVYYGDDIRDQNNDRVTHMVTPARVHGNSYLADGWAMKPTGTSAYNLWHFPMDGTTKPPLQRVYKSVPAFASSPPAHWDIVNQGTTSSPELIKSDSFVTSFVGRNQNLYIADVGPRTDGSWTGAGIRLVELLGGTSSSPVLGRATTFGSQGFVYGAPGIDVDSSGDMVVTYRRVSATSDSEARFAVWYAGDPSLSGGVQLHAGSGEFPSSSGGACTADGDCGSEDKICYMSVCRSVTGRHDTAGMAIDSTGRFYMLQPYAAATSSWRSSANWMLP
jgi:hypothetical protein